MKLGRKIFILLAAIALIASMAVSPSQVAQAQNSLGLVSYILFATDAFIQLADGIVLYNYGFVGGRSTDYVVYQNSMVAPPGAPKGFVPGGLIDGTPGGPLTGGACQGLTWGGAANTPACVTQLAGNAQFPAPLIRTALGYPAEIRLVNLGVTVRSAPNDPHSIHLHGLDVNAANDGVPETSVGAIPLNAAMPGAGNVIYYYFTPMHAGTYMYHCHQEADIHVQMGMFGALVVYEPADAAYVSWYGDGISPSGPATGGGTLMGATWTKETILLLSEFDVRQHVAEQFNGTRGAYNPVSYQPQYWSINGLSFPSTIHVAPVGVVIPNWFTSVWLPAHQGYDPLIIGSISKPDKILLRVINMGFETQPMHMHGFHGKILGSDQRGWPWAYNPAPGEGLEKNTLTIGSGETYEWLLDFSTWAAATGEYDHAPLLRTESRYFNNVGTCLGVLNAPAPTGRTDCPAIPDPFAVPPGNYVGGPTVGPLMPGPDSGSVAGMLLTAGGISAFDGQLFPFHNHDDYKATNNGVYPGGMFTMIATVP